MSRTLGYGLLSGALVITAITIGLALTTRLGSAQQLPPPTESPEDCCHVMTAGGRTIGGPAGERLQPFGGENDYQTRLLYSEQPIGMCATLSNLNDATSDSGHMLLIVTDSFPAGGGLFNPFPGPPPEAIPVHPGRTVVQCGHRSFVGVSCLTSSTHCQYRWRVDLMAEPHGVTVSRPR